ncbi:MAG TPA: dihydropteroate synthase [Ohtaekwangia sp.]
MDLHTPRVMGILNITPDSFYDGGRYETKTSLLNRVEQMLREGASLIDLGGYSTRPGAKDISTDEELKRVVPAIKDVVKSFPEALISIDTFRSEVAQAAVHEGACMINDVTGGSADPKMYQTVANLSVPYIVMHMRGTPQTMTSLTEYENLLKELTDYFHERIARLESLGVKDILIDPGIGFAKTPSQNFQLLNQLHYFSITQRPILIGVSRKSTIWKTLSITPEEALNGTTALNTIALLKGASLLRVHDVKEAVEVVKLVSQLSMVTSSH